jgi:Spy/CpxP family protein refolding chaperone
MDPTRIFRFVFCCLLLAGPVPVLAEPGEGMATLSAEKVRGLQAGAGLGYAKAADLNGWPGPLHALQMKDALSLSAEQVRKITVLRREMTARAKPLGGELIDAERTLNQLFTTGEPSAAEIEAATARIAAIEGRLRAVHLVTHLRTAPLLTRHQTMLYVRARGVSNMKNHRGHPSGG